MSRIDVRLFGGLELLGNDGEVLALNGQKTRALLGFLLVEPDRWHTRDRLAAILWADRSERQARHSLNQSLYEIRRLETLAQVQLIARETNRIRLRSECADRDVARFEDAIRTDPVRAADLRPGDLLEGYDSVSSEFSDWIRSKRTQLDCAWRDVLRTMVGDAIEKGGSDSALSAARLLVDLDLLDESAWRSHMVLLIKAGNRTEAMRRYDACAKLLKEELGIEPEAATRQVLEDIQSGTEGPTTVSAKMDTTVKPARNSELPDRPTIAVMPFANFSGDPEDSLFANGIAQDLITDLSRFEDLFVLSSTPKMKYNSSEIDAAIVARELRTQFVLEGNVRKSGHRVRITTQLFSGYEGRRVWSERYDGTLEDVFALQEHLAGRVAGNVAYKMRVGHLEQALRVPVETNSAHHLAWHAQALWGEAFRIKDPLKVDYIIDLAKTALQIDSKCAIAYQTICDGYASKGLYRWGSDPSDAVAISEQSAKDYLLHFPNSYMAYYHLARARFQLARFEEASRDYKIAHEMNPNDSLVLRYWAWCEAGAGDFQNARRHALLAIRLSPMDPRMHISYLALAMCAFIERNNSEFEEWAEKAINMLPSAPIRRAMMISYAAENGRQDLMDTHLNELMSWAPDFIDSLFRGENRPFQRDEHMKVLLDGLRKAGFPKGQTSSRIVSISRVPQRGGKGK